MAVIPTELEQTPQEDRVIIDSSFSLNSNDPLIPINAKPESYEELLQKLISAESTESLQNEDRRRLLYKVFCFVSVCLAPLFSYFMYGAISSAFDDVQENLDLEGAFWDYFFGFLAFVLASFDATTGVLIVNPIEEAVEYYRSQSDSKWLEVMQEHNLQDSNCVIGCAQVNRIIVKSVNIIVASSDLVSLASLSQNPGVYWGLGIPASGLSFIYLNMISTDAVNEHTIAFVAEPKCNLLKKAILSPAKSLEVTIQVLVNAGNRSISRAYMMKRFFNVILDQSKGTPLTVMVIYASASTFYTCIFTRTLNVQRQLFNEKFNSISAEILRQMKISKPGYFIAGFLSLLRAGSIATLLYRHVSNLSLKTSLCIMLGLFSLTHNLYVRLDKHKKMLALASQAHPENLLARIRAEILNQQHVPTDQIFDLVQTRFRTKKVDLVATTLNVGTRIASWCSFLGFIVELNKLLMDITGVSLDFVDLVCIQQILCNPSQENDASFYQSRITEQLVYYKTKFNLEKGVSGWRFLSLFKEKTEYPRSYLLQQSPLLLEAGQSHENVEDGQKLSDPSDFKSLTFQYQNKNMEAPALGDVRSTSRPSP